MILGRIYFRDVSLVDNHVFKCSNKNEHVAKESYFKVFAFMTVNNCCAMKLTYMKWDLIQ